MELLIRNEKSFLKLYTKEVVNEMEIDIEGCIKEIKDNLIKNPPIIVYGKPAIQHRSILMTQLVIIIQEN